jgi:HAD superfamily hydrolase (TIGR01509 family)
VPISRALLLDFDGTLVDSIGALKQAYGQFMRHVGKTPTDAEFNHLNGPPLSVGVAYLRETHGLAPDVNELLAHYLHLVAQAYEHARPANGARELLHKAQSKGWSTAIVTSNLKAETQRWLVRWELDPTIDAIVGGDSVAHGKPAPDPYLSALSLLGCRSEFAIAVEDSATGIRSATGAGVKTYALDPLRRLSRDVLDLPYVAGVIDHLSDVAEHIS